MSFVLDALAFIQETINAWRYPPPEKNENALKVGVLSTATIDVSSIIEPCKSHPDILLYGIALQDAPTAESHAQIYGFAHSYASYSALLADPAIDFVHISLPTSLHFEWAAKSLEAGKHVVVGGGGAFTANAEEAQALVQLAEEKGLVCMDASAHWSFHPAAHRFKEILSDSARVGKAVKTEARATATPAVSKGESPVSDASGRWSYDMGGGSLMHLGGVPVGVTRFALRTGTPEKILFAKAYPAEHDERVDGSMHATMKFSRRSSKRRSVSGLAAGKGDEDVYSAVYTDFARAWWRGLVPRVWELPSVRVETEHAEVYLYNAQAPHLYHYIAVTDKGTGATAYEQAYKGGVAWGERGEAWWSSHRYQLEAFVDRVRGREPAWWYDGGESVMEMQTLDEVYTASGLPLRKTSAYLSRT